MTVNLLFISSPLPGPLKFGTPGDDLPHVVVIDLGDHHGGHISCQCPTGELGHTEQNLLSWVGQLLDGISFNNHSKNFFFPTHFNFNQLTKTLLSPTRSTVYHLQEKKDNSLLPSGTGTDISNFPARCLANLPASPLPAARCVTLLMEATLNPAARPTTW